uniref:Uncharacterized protein n=1 Tax=Erwinia amylovora ATCC BAA-2158 TaxID=889211 RepID=E5B495_ERWAM|nr:hypothetical protein predicted by Glimmer/Critica [Erwinia amylovora ATCC BAA-2158]
MTQPSFAIIHGDESDKAAYMPANYPMGAGVITVFTRGKRRVNRCMGQPHRLAAVHQRIGC